MTDKIINEKNPLMREIYAIGYTHVIEDMVSFKMILINKNTNYKKEIPMNEFTQVVAMLKFIKSILPNGDDHIWIKEEDGSADLFIKLIQPTT